MWYFVVTSTDTGSSSIGSVVTFQSDGIPLLRLHIQVTVDNGTSYLYVYRSSIEVPVPQTISDVGKRPVLYIM